MTPGDRRPQGGSVEADTLSCEERQNLLRLAREAIEAHLTGGPSPRHAVAQGALAQRRGAFVTLCRRGSHALRGCVGLLASDRPLAETVARMAVAAATEDTRFEPVTLDELPQLEVDISVLGPLVPVRPEEVEVGRHGLLLMYRGHRGVLLPQVAVEHGWDRETFLGHTCWKAGLPESAWREPDAEIHAFTAEVFGDEGAAEDPG